MLAIPYAVYVIQDTRPLYLVESVVLPLLWICAVALAGGYDRRFLGTGPEEFRRIGLAAVSLVALTGFASWAVAFHVSRSFVIVILPTTAVSTWLGRYLLRKWIHRQRAVGRYTNRTLVVGPPNRVADLVERFRRNAHYGFEVVGACVPSPADLDSTSNVPIVGTFDTIVESVQNLQADTVAVVASPEMDGNALRRLSWALEPTGANLAVAPGLVEVTGPRMAVRPVDGLPLLHVEHPHFRGLRRLVKSVYEPVLAGAALLVLSPLLLAIAVGIKIDSPGPVFFVQTRVGRLGQSFRIFKFRTMVVDADQRKHEFTHLDEGAGPLFKSRNDPRITKVGAFLRRTSLDELPQLANVVAGQMSLVGPRPHLPVEVALFGEDFCRRLLVKPGLTGLWQISGRSDLSYEESVRLDLRYVENWTLTWDLYIMWRTLSVMTRRSGAY